MATSDSPGTTGSNGAAGEAAEGLIAAEGIAAIEAASSLIQDEGFQSVISTNVAAIEYHSDLGQLDVWFHSGWFYHFYVPSYIYEGMLASTSKGHYVHAVLDKYPYVRVY